MANLMMEFKLTTQAERHWRKLNGFHLLAHVIEGVIFNDGIIPNTA